MGIPLVLVEAVARCLCFVLRQYESEGGLERAGEQDQTSVEDLPHAPRSIITLLEWAQQLDVAQCCNRFIELSRLELVRRRRALSRWRPRLDTDLLCVSGRQPDSSASSEGARSKWRRGGGKESGHKTIG